VAVRRRRRDFTPYVDARLTKKHVRLHLFPRCGVPNVFRVQIRLASLYKFDFCLGRVRDTIILWPEPRRTRCVFFSSTI
jgi:hypothetical protein